MYKQQYYEIPLEMQVLVYQIISRHLYNKA